MAISFTDNGTDHIDYGSAATLDNIDPLTIAAWMFLDNVSGTFRGWTAKINSAGSTGWWVGRTGLDGTALRMGTGSGTIDSGTGFYAASKWIYVVVVCDFTNGQGAVFGGDLTTKATDQTGTVSFSGADDDSANDLVLGVIEGDSFGWPGDIAWFGIWNAEWTLAQAVAQQYQLWHITDRANNRIFSHPGIDGTGTQADWSGNGNNGTISGTPTVAPHVPLPLWPQQVAAPYEVAVPVGDLSVNVSDAAGVAESINPALGHNVKRTDDDLDLWRQGVKIIG